MTLRPLASLLAPVALAPSALTLLFAACSSSSAGSTGSASISGPSVVTVKSAALIQTDTITEAGTGGQTTYVQFFSNAPGASCAALDASNIGLAGSFQVSLAPSTLPGTTLTFGSSATPLLTLVASTSADAGDTDAGFGPSFVANGGTIAFTGSGTNLAGTIHAEMVLASSPGSAPVAITGTFTAPLCGN